VEMLHFHRISQFFRSTDWPHLISVRCWAAIPLSSSRIVRLCRGRWPLDWTVKDNMVNGLFFCATSHKTQKGQYSICVGRSGNVRDGCGGGQAGPALF